MDTAILLNNPIKNIVIPSGLVPKGAYDNSTDYAVGDYVTYLGTSYVMFLDAPAGTLPTDTSYWQILASKGNTGDSSPLWELDGTTLKPTDTSYLPTTVLTGLTTTSTDGYLLTNTSPALVGTTVQMSPRLRFRGSAWDTDDATSRTSDWIIENLPATGNTVSSTLRFGHSLAGATYTYPMTLSNAGTITIQGHFYGADGAVFGNGVSTSRGYFQVGTTASGNLINRNIADAYTTQTINNAHASSTGNILDLQWQGVNRISFTKNGSINLNTTDNAGAGTININGNRYFHAYSPANALDTNLFVGSGAGNFTMGGTGDQGGSNVGIGKATLQPNTTGYWNTSVGNYSLRYNQTGNENVAIGAEALNINVSGNKNTAIGTYSLDKNTVSNLTAVGADSLYSNTTGTGLVAVGYQAGKFNVKGTNNSYFGYQAGYSGTTVVNSIAITNGGTGYTAGALIVDNTGTGGTGLAGTYTVDGSGTILAITITAVGSGYNSVPVVTPQPGGSNAVLTAVLSSANSNTTNGYQALYSNTYGFSNIAIGGLALYFNVKGNYGVAIGDYSLYNSNTNGNTGIGAYSLYGTTTGSSNFGLGVNAGRNNTIGSNNIYIGAESAYKSGVTATGSGNCYLGYQTGINATGSYNMFFGYMAGKYETGSYKLFIDNRDRTDEATARTNSLIYGVTDATPANQTLNVNGVLTALGYKSSDGSAGVSGTFTTTDGKTITIKDGIVTSII